jgi:hypothetical protein
LLTSEPSEVQGIDSTLEAVAVRRVANDVSTLANRPESDCLCLTCFIEYVSRASSPFKMTVRPDDANRAEIESPVVVGINCFINVYANLSSASKCKKHEAVLGVHTMYSRCAILRMWSPRDKLLSILEPITDEPLRH